MTIEQIESTLNQLKEQVQSLTASLNSIVSTLSNFATTDDLSVVADQVNELQQDNETLSNNVAQLSTDIQRINNIKNLIDVQINDLTNPLTEGDVLQYGYDGKWHNVQLSISSSGGTGGGSDSPSGVSRLSELSDVVLSSVYDGQVLMYNGARGLWVNKEIQTSSGDVNGMTQADADRRYLKLTGGEITGDLLVTGDITFHNT